MMGTADHPMRKIHPLIDPARIRQLYAETGGPSIPPEQLFPAILGGYLLGVTSKRTLVRKLTGNLVLHWFVGLDLDQRPRNHSTFSQNRKRRLTESGLLERIFDETVALAITRKLVSPHATLNGTLVQTNALHKSFVPMEVFLKPEDYKKQIQSLDAGSEPDQDLGNPTVTFRGERRSKQTHGSPTDPDAKLANKGNGIAAMVGSTVTSLMKNWHRLLLGINVETCRGLASEMDRRRELLDRFHATQTRRIQTVGANKGCFANTFLTALVK